MTEPEHWMPREHAESSRKVIAFVHGMGAENPQQYWSQFIQVLQSDLNTPVKDFNIFVWGYSTHKRSSLFENVRSSIKLGTLNEAAPGIKLLGGAWDATYQTQFRDYQEVVLICHSMGGLVIKSWITDVLGKGQSTKLDKLRHISFYATPHNGAPIATLTAWNDQLKDMKLDSTFIAELGERWQTHVVNWRGRRFDESDRLYNRYIPHLVIAGINDNVVPHNFAVIRDMPYVDVQGNHRQVIQPNDVNDTRYKVWRHDLVEILALNATHQMRGEKVMSGVKLSEEGSNAPGLAASTYMLDPSVAQKLRKILSERFDAEEFRNLCFDLSVSFDGLRGEGLDGKVRELVSYLQRRKQLDKLISYLKQSMPDIEI